MSLALASRDLEIKSRGRGTLVMSGRLVEAAMRHGHCRELVDRAFTIPGLSALELDRASCRARLRFAPEAGPVPELLRRLARAMRGAAPEPFALADLDLIQALSRDHPITIRREGGRLTFLRVSCVLPERYRFLHPAFADPVVRSAVLLELLSVAYLDERIGSGWNGGYIEVEFQAGRMTLESLLDVIEAALLRTIASGPRYHLQPLDFRKHLVDTNLALAVLSDFLFPPARFLSVISLWLLNAKHVRPTIRSLREWRFNTEVLYSTVACLTLISLSFIGSALMYWMFEFWPRRVKALREAETAKFLARLKRCPHSVWVERSGAEMEVALSHAQLGDTVILRQGDIAPGDGLVLAGNAMLAESWAAGPRQKEAGDRIHCSGQIAEGETRIRLDSLGTGAATARLAQWHARAMDARVSKESVRRVADSAVLPALAFGALALSRGGVTMAKSVIRPDYVTGPSIARELGWVTSVIEAAQHGVFLRNDSALEKLAQCDCFVFGPGVAWLPGARPPAEIAQALRDLGVAEILMPSGGMQGGRSLAVRQPGVVPGIGDSRPVDAGGLIKERQFLGRQVAFFGDCALYAGAAAQADAAVHVCQPPFGEEPPGEIALLEPALEAVLALRAIAAGFEGRVKGSFAAALVPNVACVAGALYFGLPLLGVLALTNAGTLFSYLEAGRALQAAGSAGGR